MVKPTPPSHAWTEIERLEALRSYDIFGSEPEPAYDGVVEIAAEVCNAPIALISLVGDDEQWFKAHIGLDTTATARKWSFCAHAIEADADLVVLDAANDPRFIDNPLVTGDPNIRFYAGKVLRDPQGLPLGSLCVIDTKDRPEGLTEAQARSLDILARQVAVNLELRKSQRSHERLVDAGRDRDARISDQEFELTQIASSLAQSEARFRAISDSMPQMVWSTLPDGFHDYYNARWYEFTGVPEGSTDGEAWNGMFHPNDQDRAWARWRHSLATGEPYDIEYRLRHRSGVYRWVLGRALPIRDEAGRITRWFGTCTDIEELKRLEAEREVVSQELSHRIKNIFAVVSALIALSARHHPEARDFATTLKTRIQALARAHAFVRPHTAEADPSSEGTTLHAFLRELTAPYLSTDGTNLVVEGDDAVFDDQAATPVALLFHELATNAIKYGALSVPDGHVGIRTTHTGDLYRIEWVERGGPPLQVPPAAPGFGFTLARIAIEGQLGGRFEQTWTPEGLLFLAELPVTALQRRRYALGAMEP